jgi:Protein of unknown function (DUF2599)
MKKILAVVSLCSILFYWFSPSFTQAKWEKWQKRDKTKIIHELSSKDPYKIKSEWMNKKSDGKYRSEQKQYDMSIDIDTTEKKITFRKKWVDFKIGMPKSKWEVTTENIDGQVVSSDDSVDIVTQSIDGGIRQIININSSDASKYYDFPLTIPTGYTLTKNASGSISILDTEGKIYTAILAPWAKDANGNDIPTWYTIEANSTLRQYIDFNENSVFPITADPAWCGASIASTSWINRSGVWSLSINPTACGKLWIGWAGWFNINDSWQEVLNMTPVSIYWNKAYWTNTYWSMYYQYACHPNVASLLLKFPWNIEPSRPNVWYLATIANWCNP